MGVFAESCWTRFKRTVLLAWEVVAAFLDSLISSLDKISEAYREVLTVLKKEQELHKRELRNRVTHLLKSFKRISCL